MVGSGDLETLRVESGLGVGPGSVGFLWHCNPSAVGSAGARGSRGCFAAIYLPPRLEKDDSRRAARGKIARVEGTVTPQNSEPGTVTPKTGTVTAEEGTVTHRPAL